MFEHFIMSDVSKSRRNQDAVCGAVEGRQTSWRGVCGSSEKGAVFATPAQGD